jgi:hypothetical protein
MNNQSNTGEELIMAVVSGLVSAFALYLTFITLFV